MIQPNPGHRGDPLFLPDVLRAYGVNTVEFDAWRDRGHGDFGTIWGVVCHHTGSNNASAASIAYGTPDLEGPVSQIHLNRNGVATIVAAGIAWHAGIGSWPGIQTNNANQVTIGIEANSNGTDPWPPAMLDAYYRICAAICWYLGLSSQRVIGHKEWAAIQGKWDPGGINMDDFRAHVQYYIDNPPFIPKEEEDMAFWDEVIPSLVSPDKSFSRRDFFSFIDYHSTRADLQSQQTLAQANAALTQAQQTLAEVKAARQDIANLVALISGKQV